MKKVVVLIFYVFNLIINLYSQEYNLVDTVEYIVNYDYTVQKDSTNIDSKETELMSLNIGNKLSKFQFYTRNSADSTFYANRNKTDDQILMAVYNKMGSLPMAGFLSRYKVFKSLYDNKCDLYGIMKKSYHVELSRSFDWELLSKSDTVINGFKATKAVTSYAGRKYEAWYTMEIPIQEGPYLFHGLPGLIIKIQDFKREHVWEIKSFKKSKSNKYIYALDINKAIKVCMEDFCRARKNYIEEKIKMFAGNTRVQLSDDEYGDVANRLMRKNNFIEKF